MKEANEDNSKSLGYKIGYLAGIVLSGCILALAVALTAKFIMWLF